MNAPFHQHLRHRAEPIWDAIFAHPFLTELGDGSLSREQFLFFVRQDYLYLQDFARAICLGGAKADSLETLAVFADHAATVVHVEQNLHGTWSAKLDVTPEDLVGTRRAPVTQAYTRHILAVAHAGTLAETVAVLLPCYWIYWEVGKQLAKALPDDPMYAEWAQAYASEGFGSHVRQQLDLIDRLGPLVGPTERERIEDHFIHSSRYEYLFWDQAYHQQSWAV